MSQNPRGSLDVEDRQDATVVTGDQRDSTASPQRETSASSRRQSIASSAEKRRKSSAGGQDPTEKPFVPDPNDVFDDEKMAAATVIQRFIRGIFVRRALAFVVYLEDEILEVPKPGDAAVAFLNNISEQLVAAEAAAAAAIAGVGEDEEDPLGESAVDGAAATSKLEQALLDNLDEAPHEIQRKTKRKDTDTRSRISVSSSVKGVDARSVRSDGRSVRSDGRSVIAEEPDPVVLQEALTRIFAEYQGRVHGVKEAKGKVLAQEETEKADETQATARFAASALCHFLEGSFFSSTQKASDASPVDPTQSMPVSVDDAVETKPIAPAVPQIQIQLDADMLDRIHLHHRRRQRNKDCMTYVRLTLVVHGDTDQSHKSGMVGNPKRPLTSEGWQQVTRSAWALRLHEEWSPGVILTSPEQSCLQTAERLRAIHTDDTDGEPEPPPEPGQLPRPKRPLPPPAVKCNAMEFPGTWKSLGPESFRVVDALVREFGKLDKASGRQRLWDPAMTAPPVLPALLIGSALLQETMLACLTSGSRYTDEAGGRLGGGSRMCGGDMMILKSPRLRFVSGEEFKEEMLPSGDIWTRALRKPNWLVVQHIRGNGKPSEKPATKTSKGWVPSYYARSPEIIQMESTIQAALAYNPFEDLDEDGEFAWGAKEVTDFGQEWRSYVGEPLIYSHEEFSRLVQRAGHPHRPPRDHTIRPIRPLIKDFIFKEPPPPVEEVTLPAPIEKDKTTKGKRRASRLPQPVQTAPEPTLAVRGDDDGWAEAAAVHSNDH